MEDQPTDMIGGGIPDCQLSVVEYMQFNQSRLQQFILEAFACHSPSSKLRGSQHSQQLMHNIDHFFQEMHNFYRLMYSSNTTGVRQLDWLHNAVRVLLHLCRVCKHLVCLHVLPSKQHRKHLHLAWMETVKLKLLYSGFSAADLDELRAFSAHLNSCLSQPPPSCSISLPRPLHLQLWDWRRAASTVVDCLSVSLVEPQPTQSDWDEFLARAAGHKTAAAATASGGGGLTQRHSSGQLVSQRLAGLHDLSFSGDLGVMIPVRASIRIPPRLGLLHEQGVGPAACRQRSLLDLRRRIQVCVELPDARFLQWRPPEHAWESRSGQGEAGLQEIHQLEEEDDEGAIYDLTTNVPFRAERWSQTSTVSLFIGFDLRPTGLNGGLAAGEHDHPVPVESDRRRSVLRLTPQAALNISVEGRK